MKFRVIVDGASGGLYEEQADALLAFEEAAAGEFKHGVELVRILATATRGLKIEKSFRECSAAKKPRAARKQRAVESA